MRKIVVAGAAGQVGSRLCALLANAGHVVLGIDRNVRPQDAPKGVVWIRSDLLEPQNYAHALSGYEIVIDCAGLAGKARPADYMRENVEATRTLLNAAVNAGVTRFIYISSIAAKFTDRKHYVYADSRNAAEAVVSAAPLSWTIIRPTMIFGPDSAVQANLSKLAGLPVTPVFGDGLSKVQPVVSDDVAALLSQLAFGDDAAGATIEVGGAETFDMHGLLSKLRTLNGADQPAKFVHLPLSFMRASLAMVEGAVFKFLPFTSGQLAAFANDAIADPHPLMAKYLPAPQVLDERIVPPKGAHTTSDSALGKEFYLFTRHLTRTGGTAYQESKYIDFHRRHPLEPIDAFEGLLLKVARSGAFGVWLTDSFTGLLGRQSVVRAKLVLTMALLESAPPSFHELDAPDPKGMAWPFMVLRGIEAAFGVLLGALIFIPAKLILGRKAKGARS
ncbi:NAD-dependent epimerase/dehydratase family protein [Asticcacaulis machinosus]|uniref:NAD(P)H-binding protein n=1 Tax=Asticcacaulis machinosus TaxID=2984211 RepID=A0ABT5HK41_9CAUL|nr:NAD(P)H-binding protein [Asticcacaulis machinosus]